MHLLLTLLAGGFVGALVELDPRFWAAAVRASYHVVTALHTLQGTVGAQIATLEAALSSKQHDISQLLDSACWVAQLGRSSPVAQAVLHSEAGVGARAFLNAMHSAPTRMEPAAFITELRIRRACLKPLATAAAHFVMGCWTAGAIMLACAWRVANAP